MPVARSLRDELFARSWAANLRALKRSSKKPSVRSSFISPAGYRIKFGEVGRRRAEVVGALRAEFAGQPVKVVVDRRGLNVFVAPNVATRRFKAIFPTLKQNRAEGHWMLTFSLPRYAVPEQASRAGWFVGRVKNVYPRLGIAELERRGGGVVTIPIRDFNQVVDYPKRCDLQFRIGEYGGVVEVIFGPDDQRKAVA